MNIDQLETLNHQDKVKSVNFVESGSGPMVIEVEYKCDKGLVRELIKDDDGHVVTCKQLKEGYDICLKAGVHKANLVQIVPDDETSQSDYADYHKESVPLIF